MTDDMIQALFDAPPTAADEHVAQIRAEVDALDGDVLRACLVLQRLEIERLRTAAEYAAHQLGKARIWGGMEWHYNPLHPLHYRSALERLRDALRHNALGQRGAACGASAAPTGCASNGDTENK